MTDNPENPMFRSRNPAVIAPPIGKYAHLVEPPPGHRLVFVAGQVGISPSGMLPADAGEQTRLVFANLGLLLGELGVGPERVVKMLTFVVGTGNLTAWSIARDAVYTEWYPHGHYPAHALAVVAGLARADLLVETEAIVAVPVDA
ncbi:RidA family protein [Streptomyces sp. R39]|uniref:RidA family protein n=1 Tax=Streptomyces sp. R39 TaxID=3238631 RepID=A0AB39QYD1_9ACTN